MQIEVKRLECTEAYTRGELWLDGKFFCYTLEDPVTDVKVYGESCIGYGKYKIGFKEAYTPMTKKYHKRFPDFFTRHLEIKDVGNYTDIYLHVGNYTRDTLGCVLLGTGKGSNVEGALITNSTGAFTEFYKIVSNALVEGVEVTLEITGE